MSTFETLFSNNPAPMAISDEQKFIEVNSAFLEVLGYPRDEVIGNSLFKLGLFSDMEKYRRIMGEINANGRLKQTEIRVNCKDGHVMDGLYSGEIIEYHGRSCLLSVLVDITEFKQREEAERFFPGQSGSPGHS